MHIENNNRDIAASINIIARDQKLWINKAIRT